MFEFIKLTSNYSNVIMVKPQEDDANYYDLIAKGNDVQSVFDYIKNLFEHGTCEFLMVEAGVIQKRSISSINVATLTFTYFDGNNNTLTTFTAPDGNVYVGFTYAK